MPAVRAAAAALLCAAAARGAPRAGGRCFKDAVWAEGDINVVQGVQYGSAFNNITRRQQPLLLDAYLPPDSDTRTLRPAAVLVHGGSFQGGDRTSDGQPQFAMNLATRGFVVVSIDYRLLGNDPPAGYGLETDVPMLAAVEDARAAVRFVRSQAADYRIDTDRILFEGDSAGAVTGLYYGCVRDAQGEGRSGNPGYDSSVRLVVSFSGDLKDQAFCAQIHPAPRGCGVNGSIDHTGEVGSFPGQPALFMVHGTEDFTVPYVNARAVYDKAQAAGLPSSLVTIQGAGHVPWDEFYNSPTYVEQFLSFMYDSMDLAHAQCPHSLSSTP